MVYSVFDGGESADNTLGIGDILRGVKRNIKVNLLNVSRILRAEEIQN